MKRNREREKQRERERGRARVLRGREGERWWIGGRGEGGYQLGGPNTNSYVDLHKKLGVVPHVVRRTEMHWKYHVRAGCACQK